MILLGHGIDGEPQVYAQLGQHPPRRNTASALGDSLLFENFWPPDLADMLVARPLMVTMLLSTVPSVDCKRAAAARSPSSGEREVIVLSPFCA
jgi:hypothetical protein